MRRIFAETIRAEALLSRSQLEKLAAEFARAATPAIVFGLRLWASVCLALYVSFKLELSNAYWAGTTAALMCQPHLGASLRKGWFRMLGTIVGAVMAVVLTSLFPQDRGAFLFSLALWIAACALTATLLRNFASYAAALAGFTAAIIATDQLGAVGGLNGDAFMLAVYRSSEIIIGIVCAGVVLAATDLGGARRRLAELLAPLTAEIATGINATLRAGPDTLPFQSIRRDLTRRVIALDPIIDEAIGESAGIRYHSAVLRHTVSGLFSALVAWRGLAAHLASLNPAAAREAVDSVARKISPELLASAHPNETHYWLSHPVSLRQGYELAAHALVTDPAKTPSARLLADQVAKSLSGLASALDGLALLLADPLRPSVQNRHFHLAVPDWAPALINALRAFVAIVAVSIFWIATAWPSGALAITWVAISVTIFAPRAEEASSFASQFMLGCIVSACITSVFLFALLPQLVTFTALCGALFLFLVPTGALMFRSPTPFVVALVANFIPLMSPANQMTYDTLQFYNNATAILVGTGAAVFFFRIIPPLSPEARTRRLLALTRRDLRRLASMPDAVNSEDWCTHLYGRLIAMPPAAEPVQRAQILAALAIGEQIIQLRILARKLGLSEDLERTLEALRQGDTAQTRSDLTALDARLSIIPEENSQYQNAQRARSSILAISEALDQHASYIGAPQ